MFFMFSQSAAALDANIYAPLQQNKHNNDLLHLYHL